GTATAAPPVLQPQAREHAIEGGLRRRIGHLGVQHRLNRPRPILAQDALFAQAPAKRYDPLLDMARRAIPSASALAIRELDAVQAISLSACDPKAHRARINMQSRRYRAHTFTAAHQPHQFPPLLNARFLAM